MEKSGRLAERIAREIRERGPISFARFMERALYEPGLGYYARPEARIGRNGDFVTSPALSPAFGRTLARLVPLVREAAGRPDRLRLVDAGAGEGALLAALCAALADSGTDLVRDLEPIVVERGDALRQRATERLGALGAAPVALLSTSELRRLPPAAGLVLANEILDALPVRRLRRRRGGPVEEAWVTLVAGRLVETWREIDPGIDPGPLPRDREVAVATGVEELMGDLAAAFAAGLLLVIDYGYPQGVLRAAGGCGSAARGFRGGSLVDDLVTDPGSVDLTANGDFTAVARAASALGLETVFFTDQTYLLLALGFLDDPAAAAARRLIHPEDLGGAFRCLALARGLDPAPLRRLEVRDRSRQLSTAARGGGPVRTA